MLKTSNCCRFILTLLALATVAATTVAHAQTFSVLYNFGTNAGDPQSPYFSGIIAQGRDGNIDITAPTGGAQGYGAAFRITPGGTLTMPYSFDETDEDSFSGLTLGTDGNFYGTTYEGGTSSDGTVFKITPSGTRVTLYSFTNNGDGANPYAPPIQGTDGNFYGTTLQGGANGPDYGTVYKIIPSAKFTTLYSFDGTHGYYPFAPLVQGIDGNFYGTTQGGGTSDLVWYTRSRPLTSSPFSTTLTDRMVHSVMHPSRTGQDHRL
jgi:uncharacterized repeat protein (TIGR03803 family)